MFKLPSPAIQIQHNIETIFKIRERENNRFELPPPIIPTIDKIRETVFVINERNTYENYLKRVRQRIESLKKLNEQLLI